MPFYLLVVFRFIEILGNSFFIFRLLLKVYILSTKKRNTASRKPSSSSRSSGGRRVKRQTQTRTMPKWLRNVLAVCIVLFLSASFYWFFVRPYAYRWKPCYGRYVYLAVTKCMELTFLIIREILTGRCWHVTGSPISRFILFL